MIKLAHTKKRVWAIALAFAAVSLTATSCKNDDAPAVDEVVDPEFAVIVGTDNGRYMLPIENLMSGIISPVGKGTNVSDILTWEENLMQKGRDMYHVNPEANKFGKYRFEDGVLKTIREIPFSQLPSLYLGWHAWLSDTELMFGARSNNYYAIVDVENMVVTKSGEFDKTGLPANHSRRVFSVIPQGNKLFLAYGLYNEETKVHYDKSYTAVIDYPSLSNLQVTGEDSRSAPLGTVRNSYFSNFHDNGYTYILTIPMPVLGGGKAAMPTAIYRVKDGESKLDPNYFFNISAQRGGDNQLGVTYIGNGKAMLISAHDTQTNIKEFNDWWYAAMWEYLIIDVNTQQVVKKLDFPLVGNSRSGVVHNGKAYIAVNDPKADGVYVWEYDSAADKLTRGARIDGADGDTPMLYRLK
ncbi:hypothetical protein [Sphingobacterium deserti]|uniref:DUF4374 domain-containing protein n=1 Tax=Sphingobacterium deserti TaxID=1229276 RepID=A0A0B8T296_9SPHI|nr:hypothetical protein [Sphingobacterium deserti]KGE12938.1 hypothetical protein DI53_3375 [Sphingobacterium deserti]